jgi:hypothetical protein
MDSLTQRIIVVALAAMLAACGGGGSKTGTDTKSGTGGDAGNGNVDTTSAAFITRPATGSAPSSTPIADTTAASIANGLPTGPNGNKAAIGTFSLAERDQVLADGIKVWRAQRIDINGINKGACANCHSADGIELTMWDFHDDDVRRRAHIDGVNEKDRELLVKYFAALRQKYSIKTLKSIQDDRPFQPGESDNNTPFDGATVAERDFKFVDVTLRSVAPTLFGQMDTLAKAVQARAELKATNPLKMRVGIPFPRMSEDCFRGSEHCSLNDWMSDLPQIPKPEKSAEWFALNDAYIANPSPENLREVLKAIDTMTDGWRNPGETESGPSGGLGYTKFKSMQILQHVLRRRQLGLPVDADPLEAVRAFDQKRPNAPFLVGDWSFNKFGAKWEQPSQMPTFVRKGLGESSSHVLTGFNPSKEGTSDVEIKKAEMAIPWWYAGFVFDSFLKSGTGGEYFLGNLGTDQNNAYPFHRYYAIGRVGAINDQLRRSNRGTLTTADVAALNVAFGSPGWRSIGREDLPRLHSTLASRQLYRKLEMNWALMVMLLDREQLQKSGLAGFNADEIEKHLCAASGEFSLRQWTASAIGLEGERAEFALKLYNEINSLAKCSNPPLSATYTVGSGTGLTLTWYKGSGDALGGAPSAITNGSVLATKVEPIVDFPGRENGKGYFSAWATSVGFNVTEDMPKAQDASAIGTGFIMAPVTGVYEIVLETKNSTYGRMSVAGVEVFKTFAFINDGAQAKQTVSLTAGVKYPIRFERHGNASGGVQIIWRTLDGALPSTKIPTSQLYPN